MKWYSCPDGLLWSDPPSAANAGVGQFGQQPCLAGPPTQDIFETKTFENLPWTFGYQIVDEEGLVLNYIKAGNILFIQSHFESLSVPHFKMEYSGGKIKIVRFDATSDTTCPLVGPTKDPSGKNMYTLRWGFKKTYDEPDLNGTLSIDYDILIRSDATKCEFVGQQTWLQFKEGLSNCFRFIPKVSFNWQGSVPQTLESFTAFYRLDYGPVGIALDKNIDNILGNALLNTGRLEILTRETTRDGVNPTKQETIDNIHTAQVGQTVFVPGCRFTDPFFGYFGTFEPFDCNHIHWRWAATGVISTDPKSGWNWGIWPNVDVMVEPSTDQAIPEDQRGKPYLVPGQTIKIGVVKVKEGEEDPGDPLSQYVVNNEEIARTEKCEISISDQKFTLPNSPDSCQLVSADPVRVWYVATTYRQNSDTFFRHGSYVVDPKAENLIKPAINGLRSNLDSIKSGTIATTTTVTAALDESKINEILAHLDQALANGYWLSDGTLVPDPGIGNKVFADLSKAAELMQEIKNENIQDNQISLAMDSATSQAALSAHQLVLNVMNTGIGSIKEQTSTSSDDNKAEINNLLAKNEALNFSRLYYAAALTALSEADLGKSAQIIDNFRLSWNSTVIGMRQTFDALGVAPPAAIATPPTATGATTTNATTTTPATTTANGTTTTTTPTTPPTSTSCLNPPSGLISWWPAAGNADDFLGINDGILQNGASFSDNVGRQAFRLDGIDDFVELPSMDIGNTFSIDFWVYPERSAGYEHLISNHYTSNGSFGALYLRDGNLEYWQNGAAWFQQVPGSQTIQPNTWSHIALTYDGSVIRIYANGSELSSVTTTGNEHSETFHNALRIGSSIPHESSYLQGLIDDVGLYNRALSASEIQTLSSGVDKCTLTTTPTTTTTTTNGTTTTTTTPTPPTTTVTPSTPTPSITAVDLHPDSVPQFFKCGETPDTGLPSLPGLDVQSSAYTAISDGDVNTEILGKAIFDVTFSERLKNGPGPDLIVYEVGNSPEPFNVTLFSGDILTQSIQYTATSTGDADDCGFGVNAAQIDLNDFGIGEEQGGNEEIIAVTGIRVDNQGAEGCCTGADISDVVIVSPTT